jgi:hypothetical protein
MATPSKMKKLSVSDAPLTPPGVKGVTWRHMASLSLCPLTPLYALIQNLQMSINTQCEKARLAKKAKQRATQLAKKVIYDSELEEENVRLQC